MTWTPCQRIVRADIPPSLRLRGISSDVMLCWPNAALNGAADYSVDFSGLMSCGGKIVETVFAVDGAEIAWSSIFGGVVTAWIKWLSPGLQSVLVTVRTAAGENLTVSVSLNVQTAASLIVPALPAFAPNVLALGGVCFPDASGAPLVTG
ncbi:hypothetical protein [Gluconobacter sp. Gdi]|uniref:phage fiber-tail adaptor protein n=1 Tax=Gluconobacter sp. Gdi TaxID=2691888 RepID=UPI00176DC51C|nr:hypothetical protein [Gluconobacter sp. Gdi]GFE96592.1 hypothetical protein DmGdi_16650 [Gluconobacter sp. Gdi]